MPFILTDKQQQARDLMAQYPHVMLYGGGRSGKSALILRMIGIRAMRAKSKHLIGRLRFNHCKNSIFYDNWPKVKALAFPDIPVKENRSDWFLEFPNGSQIWMAGTDDKERVEKILGTEYSTIYLNEVSQIDYNTVGMLRTRLSENSGLTKRMFYDCNPPSKKHWTYKMFIEGIEPKDGTPLDMTRYASMLMNPLDNVTNLGPEYMAELESLPRRDRERFLLGLFSAETEGALWTDEGLMNARAKKPAEIKRTVIGVDPTATGKTGSDLCGIVAASIDANNDGIVHADYSLRASPQQWAQAVVNAYHKHSANYVVVETNQGGEMVKTIINSIDRNIKVKEVHASKGKFARAEPVAALYEQGKVAHAATGLDDLETELLEYVPITATGSPDRLDAMVWALTDLMLGQNKEPMMRFA